MLLLVGFGSASLAAEAGSCADTSLTDSRPGRARAPSRGRRRSLAMDASESTRPRVGGVLRPSGRLLVRRTRHPSGSRASRRPRSPRTADGSAPHLGRVAGRPPRPRASRRRTPGSTSAARTSAATSASAETSGSARRPRSSSGPSRQPRHPARPSHPRGVRRVLRRHVGEPSACARAASDGAGGDSRRLGRPSCANGNPNRSSSTNASRSVAALVVIVMSRPRVWSIAS